MRRLRVRQHLGARPRRGQPRGSPTRRRRARRRRRSTSMLAEFDQWDRYDYDFDGDFNEPDGYIDHFQIVHAGGDQADGDPYQGEDAIWSHRWYAYQSDDGVTGPPRTRSAAREIGDTGIWIGDYTIQPENGGLSVFAHEYGHDLGLPDDYDTAGGDGNPAEWWTLMAPVPPERGQRADRHAGPATSVRGRSSCSAGSTTTSPRPATPQRSSSARPSTTRNYPRPSSSGCRRRRWSNDYGPLRRRPRCTGRATGNDLDNTLTRELDLTGVDHGVAVVEDQVRHRDGLRLPVRRGVDRRRGDVDRPRRHGRRRSRSPATARATRRSPASTGGEWVDVRRAARRV